MSGASKSREFPSHKLKKKFGYGSKLGTPIIGWLVLN